MIWRSFQLSITKIVLTATVEDLAGEIADELKAMLLELGYTVSVVDVTQDDRGEDLLEKQLLCESYAERGAALGGDAAVIICLGGAMERMRGLSKDKRACLASKLGTSVTALRDGYDGVFIIGEGGAPDAELVSLWLGTPHLRAVSSSDGTERTERIRTEVLSLLGEPFPLEIERKFLIEYPDTVALSDMSNCASVEIEQIYLTSNDGEERRIRRRGGGDGCLYYLTVKSKGEGAVRTEEEHRISETEYDELLRCANPELRPIRKTRYCIMHNTSYIELDVYPFWSDRAIAEIELACEGDTFELPSFIKIIKDVTGDSAYKNSSLAKTVV